MFVSGIFNNKDGPSGIYRGPIDINEFFKNLTEENTGIYEAEKLSAVAAAHRILTNSIAWEIEDVDNVENRNAWAEVFIKRKEKAK